MKLIVNVEDAVNILKENRQRHVAEYELQTEAWKKAYTDYTDALKKWSQEQPTDGEATTRPLEPHKPDYYVESYNALLKKLSLHTKAVIELSDNYGNDYEEIFENKFNWSNRFASLTGGYVTSGYIDSAAISSVRGGI